MPDREGPTPKVIVAVPDSYHELPEDRRLAVAERLAAQIQEGLPTPRCEGDSDQLRTPALARGGAQTDCVALCRIALPRRIAAR
jgi:hypothetical protein